MFDDIVVCIPTVVGRAAVLAETLRQWDRFGVAPLVEVQPDDWPLGGASHRRTTERVLRRALDERPHASHVLFTEDDLDLSPDLPRWLPAITGLDAPVTLYLPGLWQYPPHVRRQVAAHDVLDEGFFPVRVLDAWWGSQALVLSRDLTEAVLCWDSGRIGWDIQLQQYLLAHAIPLYVTVPNLAQHRAVPSVATDDGVREGSATFGRPHNGRAISPIAQARA